MGVISGIKRSLKYSLFLRRIISPAANIGKKIEYIKYQRSDCPETIKQYQGIHEGERCFIVGNGSSLRVADLELLQNDITIGSNRIYNIFDKTKWRPTYYICEDVNAYDEVLPNLSPEDVNVCILSHKADRSNVNAKIKTLFGLFTSRKFIVNIYDDDSSHISEDVSRYFSRGYSVTFSAIQFAIYMGIKEIYLLGVDFNYAIISDKKGEPHKIDDVTTYFDGKEYTGSFLNYYSTLYAYEHAKEYCDSHGIKIFNATRGGKLEVFERVNFDDLVTQNFIGE